jgi:hypothetical protein
MEAEGGPPSCEAGHVDLDVTLGGTGDVRIRWRRDRLQVSLGTTYVLAHELGGGGMARVFVARDAALGRDIVVKVLAPELAEGLSAERFARETRLAASLQQANVVPVHAAGVADEGLPHEVLASKLGVKQRTVGKQRERVAATRLKGLLDDPRVGPPRID